MNSQPVSRKEALQDPAIRTVLDFYVTSANLVLATEVYPTLYEKYPSLREKTDSGRMFPFDTMKVHEGKLQLADDVQRVKAYMRNSRAPPLIKVSYHNAGRWAELLLAYAPIRDRFLLKMTQAIDFYAIENKVTKEDVVRNTGYMDKVTRTAFSKRKSVQLFYEASLKVATEWFKFQRVVCKIGTEFNLVDLANPFFLQNFVLIPTEEEASAIEPATLEYLTRQLERIYAIRST